MKKCCYCGRDNEDENPHCRECGTDEFYPTASSKPSKPTIFTCKRCGAQADLGGVFITARDVFLKVLARRVETESITDRIHRAVAANNLAYTDALTRKSELLPEADRYSAEARQILSWVPAIKGTRGTVLLELGRIAEAIPFLLEAMQKHDVPVNKAQSACWLAIAEASQGNLTAAQNYLKQARKFDPSCFLLERVEQTLATSVPLKA